MHWDKEIDDWKCHGAERVAAQDAVLISVGASADDDKRTNNATTGAIRHEAAAYIDVQGPSSSNLMDAPVPAASACDDEPAPHNATAGSGTSADISAPDHHGASGLPGDEGVMKLIYTHQGADDESSADPGPLV